MVSSSYAAPMQLTDLLFGRVPSAGDGAAPVDSADVPYVYAFDHKHRRPPMEMKDLLGGKGANLAEMTSVLKLPVPAGFTISTDACRAYLAAGWPKELDGEIAAQVAKLEATMGRKLGDPADPLLVSVRSGAKFSMPGMMDTVLNLGLNDKSVKGLAAATDDRFAYDSYRRFISMYGRIVLDIDGASFEHPFEAAKEAAGVTSDADLPASALKTLCTAYKAVVKEATGKAFPQDPMKQLRGAVEAVFSSWNGARRDRLPRPRADRPRPRHCRQRSGDGVRQPRRQLGYRRRLHPQRRHRRQQAVRRLPHQRPGRGRGRGHPQHRRPRRAQEALPDDPRRAARHLRPAREALPGHVRHRVHDRTGHALHAPDPSRQAHRRGRAARWPST